MNWLLALFIFSVYADPKGAGYDAPTDKSDDVSQCSDLDATCTSQPQKVVEVEEDRDKQAEDRCENKELFRNDTERESCRKVEAQNRRSRAEQRARQQSESGAVTETEKPACSAESVKANCEAFYNTALTNKDEKNVKNCEDQCSASTFKSKRKLLSCSEDEKKNVIAFIDTRRKYCSTGFAKIEDKDEDKKNLSPEEQSAYADAVEMAGGNSLLVSRMNDVNGNGPGYCAANTNGSRTCRLVSGDLYSYKVDITKTRPPSDSRLTDSLYSGDAPVVSTDNYHRKACVTYSDRSQECRSDVRSFSNPTYSYISPTGKEYESYEAYQAAQNGYVVPRPPERPAYVERLASTTGGGSTAGSASGATRVGAKTETPAATTSGGSNSGGSATGSQTSGAGQRAQNTPQQTASTTGGSGSGGGSAGGLNGGSSSSSGGSAFSNPYANTNLLEKPVSKNPQFDALSTRDVSGLRDEGVSGESSSADNYGGGGAPAPRSFASRSSEGVNGDSSLGTSSLGSSSGGGVTPVVASSERVKISHAAGDMSSSSFQSGFHKANGKETLSPSSMSKTKSMLAKLDKAKRKKVMDQCKGDMSCIASILGVTKSVRRTGVRGLASVEGQKLPQGVWSGYTDILSHMAKVHDKIPLNYDGDID